MRDLHVLHHTSEHQKGNPSCAQVTLIHTLTRVGTCQHEPCLVWENTPFPVFLCMVMDSDGSQVTSLGYVLPNDSSTELNIVKKAHRLTNIQLS